MCIKNPVVSNITRNIKCTSNNIIRNSMERNIVLD